MSEFGGLWKHENNQHAPKTECGCPSGGGIKTGHIRYPSYGGTPGEKSDEISLKSDEFGLKSAECGLKSDEFGLKSAECGLKSDESGLKRSVVFKMPSVVLKVTSFNRGTKQTRNSTI